MAARKYGLRRHAGERHQRTHEGEEKNHPPRSIGPLRRKPRCGLRGGNTCRRHSGRLPEFEDPGRRKSLRNLHKRRALLRLQKSPLSAWLRRPLLWGRVAA